MPQTAKNRQVPVTYPSATQRLGESIGVELRVRPRARNRTHIDQQIDAYLLEQSRKFGDRTR